jgi:hypothetical protein
MTVANRLVAGAAAIVFALTAGLFGSAAEAQSPMGRQVDLTPQLVEQIIASTPDVTATAKGLSAKYGMEGRNFGDSPAGMFQAWSAHQGAQADMAAVCQKYGFPDFQSWVMTFSSVATAHAFAKQGGDLDNQMAAAMKQIESNPNLTPAQKQMLLQQFQAQAASIGAMRPSQANIDAVAPYSDQLDALFRKANG